MKKRGAPKEHQLFGLSGEGGIQIPHPRKDKRTPPYEFYAEHRVRYRCVQLWKLALSNAQSEILCAAWGIPEIGITSDITGWLEAGEARCKPVRVDGIVRGICQGMAIVGNGILHRMLRIWSKPTQELSKLPRQPEWVEDLLRSQPGQAIRVMTMEERLQREAEEEQWQRRTKK
jgi:hypothetical protein